jgi:hypothetical protein
VAVQKELQQQDLMRRLTIGFEKAYDTKDFVITVRELNVTPHFAKNARNPCSNLARRESHASPAMP